MTEKALRIILAATMIVHGAARTYAGGVEPFGLFLESQGIPASFYVAAGVTVFEIVGGFVLLAGFFIPPLSFAFALQLLCGIVLVHWKAGWFVVGLGRNGMEYSVLLILCFLLIGSAKLRE